MKSRQELIEQLEGLNNNIKQIHKRIVEDNPSQEYIAFYRELKAIKKDVCNQILNLAKEG